MRNLLWIVIAIVIVGGGYWWWSTSSSSTMTNTETPTGEVTTVNEGESSAAPTGSGAAGTVLEGSGEITAPGVGGDTAAEVTTPTAPMSVTVTYDGKSYSPQNVTIKKGGTVTWKNTSSGNMWVASAQHPTHTVYDGTSRSAHCAAGYTGATPFDQCKGEAKGVDYSFKFDKVGDNGYHDHINASAFGKVTVTE